jgi:hypothetical protein
MSTPWKSSNPLLLSILMRKIALLGASALVLSLGVAKASAQPTTDQILSRGQTGTFDTFAPNAAVSEVRAVAIEAPAPDAFIYQPHRGR